MLRGEIQPQLLESLPGVGRRLSWGSAVPTRWQQRAPTKEPGELCQRARVMVSKPGPGLEGIPLRDFEKSQIPDPSPLLYSIVPIPVPEPYLAVALDGRGGQPGRKDKEREGRIGRHAYLPFHMFTDWLSAGVWMPPPRGIRTGPGGFQSLVSKSDRPGFESRLHPLQALGPWASLQALSLSPPQYRGSGIPVPCEIMVRRREFLRSRQVKLRAHPSCSVNGATVSCQDSGPPQGWVGGRGAVPVGTSLPK